jgi:hypothetical protein
MSNFHIPAPANLPSLAVQDAKEKRRQVLARAAAIRKANFRRFMEKMRTTHNTDVERAEI